MVGMGAGLMAPAALGQGEEWRILEGDDPPAGWKVFWLLAEWCSDGWLCKELLLELTIITMNEMNDDHIKTKAKSSNMQIYFIMTQI